MDKNAKSKKCPQGKKPSTCTPEEIKECHGDTKNHPCDGAKK